MLTPRAGLRQSAPIVLTNAAGGRGAVTSQGVRISRRRRRRTITSHLVARQRQRRTTRTNQNIRTEIRNETPMTYGDTLNPVKEQSSIRIMSLNINGLKQDKWQAKNDQLKNFLRTYDFDVMAFQEVNVNWSRLTTKDQWDERTFGWWEGGHHSVIAHNTEDVVDNAYQPGGTMLVTQGKSKYKIID